MKEYIKIIFEVLIWSFIYAITMGHLTTEDVRFIVLLICITEILDKNIGGKND